MSINEPVALVRDMMRGEVAKSGVVCSEFRDYFQEISQSPQLRDYDYVNGSCWRGRGGHVVGDLSTLMLLTLATQMILPLLVMAVTLSLPSCTGKRVK